MEAVNRQKINFVIPVVLLILVAIVTIYATSINWSGTVQRMETELGEQVVNQASLLCNKMDNSFSVLNGLVATYTREDIDVLDDMKKKLQQNAEKTDFVTLSFIYPDGHLYRSDGRDLDVSDRWYFKECMQGEKLVALLKNPEMDDASKIGMGVPVRLEGEVVGVLLGTYDMETFRELFEECISGVSDLSYICTSDGKYIIGTRHAVEVMEAYQPGFEENGSFFAVIENSFFSKSSEEVVKDRMKNMQGGQAAYTYYSEKRYTNYVPVGINDWFIISVLPEEQIHAEAMQAVSNSYVTLAVVMIAIITIILLLAYREHKQALREQEKAREIQYRLDHDDLTGVLCEKVFMRRVEEQLPLVLPDENCLIYLDVYKFKLINEMFGYEKGNELLCLIADELHQLARRYHGLCGRISGDKFILFMPHKEEVITLFHTRKRNTKKILPIEIYLHYGIYVIKDNTIPVNRMIDCAQLAQKAVKGNYDNYVSYYNEQIKQQVVKEQEIISSMEQALANGEFIIYLQPQYNYKEGTVSGAEALVRWNHPEKGLIPPGDFIPVFETNGFIIKLDEYVWEQVCKLQRRWIDEGKKPLPISVNVSRADLLKGCVAEKLAGLIEKYKLTPDLICVEVTETAYMDNPQKLVMEIDKLKENGLLVEMDDFGSGYSSLNMLKDVSIQVLKTDLKFLAGDGIEARKERILDSIISMAHQMGLFVIAEGVETKEQADYLLKLNCEHMQGYYFSRPIPIEAFEKMVYGD